MTPEQHAEVQRVAALVVAAHAEAETACQLVKQADEHMQRARLLMIEAYGEPPPPPENVVPIRGKQ